MPDTMAALLRMGVHRLQENGASDREDITCDEAMGALAFVKVTKEERSGIPNREAKPRSKIQSSGRL